VTVALIPVVSSSESSLRNRGQRACRRAQYTYVTYIITYPPSGAHMFNNVWTTLHTSQECIHILRKWPQGIPRSLLARPRYVVVTRRTTDVSSYRTIGTASSKPHLEATGLEFTSPGTRILTFLPWHRCVVTGSKLRKVNTESKSLLACHLLRLL
jgi:hypothetical protein